MTQNEILKKTANVIRELVDANEKLASENSSYQECVKIAFTMAKRGNIEDDFDAIVKKAEELYNNKQDLPVVKKAMELDTNYVSAIKLEKTGNSGSEFTDAERAFAEILKGN
jgi:hypothetical protein